MDSCSMKEKIIVRDYMKQLGDEEIYKKLKRIANDRKLDVFEP